MEDKSWMDLPRWTNEYNNGVKYFLNWAFDKVAQGDEISCPCKECCHRYWYRRNNVYEHLIAKGFTAGYYEWVFHGEGTSSGLDLRSASIEDSMHDEIDGLLQDTFRDVLEESEEGVRYGPNIEAKKFFKLVEEGQQELYPGCKKFSTLSFTIRLYLFKCLHGLSNIAFGDLLDLLREAFPDAKIPESFNKARNMVKDLGLDYTKIHACPNDCMLFWKNDVEATNCHVCGASRWKMDEGQVTNNVNCYSAKSHKVPAKVLRYFPLKPRLKRLFMCSETALAMQWHDRDRPKDGNLRHPADGQAWKDFDALHPDFAREPRNVRLGLASDGFNPFRTMSIAYSTWPVVLINYNLSPWICMKPEYMMLSMIIPGPHSPGRDIDVFLQPLLDELKDLWDVGSETYDASNNQSFQMRACLLWTISDFPAYGMLSGWSTKGKLACPSCNYGTCSRYLKFSRKTCYLDHRRFLDPSHPWRLDKKSFNGRLELRSAPSPLTGSEIVAKLSNFKNAFGKKHNKKVSSGGPLKKRSIFFELAYWEHNTCRHNLDVMHIEKNVCDNVLGTLLDIPGRSKDHANARFDLQDMGIRRELHPVMCSDQRRVFLAKATFSMSKAEMDCFCKVLKDAKLPQGCASNISRCVNVIERKVSGYKSHDAHFMMHYLLQVAVRKTLPKPVATALIRLGNFFRSLCSKVIKPQDLDFLQTEIVEILCHLERIFPPSFFDIMVHLPIHLVDEIKLGGPVHCRWMYSIERYLCKLKSYVRNRAHPEGSIAEGYLAEECLTFCSRYMHDGVKTRFSRYVNDTEIIADKSSSIFPNMGHPIGGKRKRKGKGFKLDNLLWNQAHRYVLFNCQDSELEKFMREHEDLAKKKSRNRWTGAVTHSQDFLTWFRVTLKSSEEVPNHIWWLSRGPNNVARRFKGYFINGYRFHTTDRDARCKTQNSGVTLSALTNSFASSKDQNPVIGDVTYYGAIKDMFELDYWGQFKVVLFECAWFDVENDNFGLTRVNCNKLVYVNDPFVLASQVDQVFYLEDPIEKGYHYVMKRVPRDLFDIPYQHDENIDNTLWGEPTDIAPDFLDNSHSLDINWTREDIPGTTTELPANISEVNTQANESDVESDYDDTDWDWMEASE